ncbi:HIT family protein [Pseudoxanthobacter sp.]|uniref:HIT family protein n=1 Tax=Pseudoxanthobacter sp. TaxID=1925742 RepID=UPI002FE00105
MAAIYDDQNIFARILRGEIPCHKVFENDDAIVIMDAMPQSPGHCLIIPKAPSRNLLDADPAALARLVPLVQKVAQAATVAFEADGINIMQFNEAPAGQTVFHLHIHVIPRRDGVPLKPHTGGMAPAEVLAAGAQKLTAALAAL